MKMFHLALCAAILAPLHAADEAPARPGFWKRTFQKTADGVGSVWDGTKNVGKKAAGAVAAPFAKKGGKDAAPPPALQNLTMTMKVEPAQIRLPDTRAIEVTVSLVNTGKTGVHLEFPTSLRVDVLVKDARGKMLSRWSDDQPIEKEPGMLLINPRERLEYSAKISTREMTAGQPFEIEAFYPSYEKLRVVKAVTPVR